MKKTRKIKFTLGMKIASILCCVALVSVGFASWWIVNYPATTAVEAGSFTVYSVDTKNVKITDVTFYDDESDQTGTAVTKDQQGNDVANADAEIIFGAPSEADKSAKFTGNTQDHRWLGYNSEGANAVATEDLTTILDFTVAVKDVVKTQGGTEEQDSQNKLSEFINKISVAFNAGDAYEGKIGSGVATPVIEYRVKSSSTENWNNIAFKSAGTYDKDSNLTLNINNSDANFTKPLDNSSLDIQVKFTFDWNYASSITENPYLYYNAQAYGDGTLATQASEVLTNVFALKDTKYTVNISTDPGQN